VTVFPGQDAGTAGAADGIHRKTIKESHSIVRNTIEVGSLIDLAAVATHRVSCVIIRHNE
jgi:hypothetical protein